MSDPVLIALIGGGFTLIPLAAKGVWTVARSMAEDEKQRAHTYKTETDKTLAAKNTEIDTLKTEVTELRHLLYGQGQRRRGS